MKSRIFGAIVGCCLTFTLLAGCSNTGGKVENTGANTEAAQTATGEGKDMTFVIVPKTVHAWFDQVNIGAKKQADMLSAQTGRKITIDYRAPENADVTEQNSTLEQAAATHPD